MMMASHSMHRARLTAGDLEDAADDPTLADCCRRDLEQQAATTRLVNQLRGADRTTERTNVARRVLVAEAAPANAHAAVCCERHGSDGCCQDSELGRLRQRRMQQMRTEAVRSRDAAALQYGALHEAPQEDALAAMRLAHQCVCHMAGGGVAADQAVDEALQLLARLHQHALFLRVPFERDGPLAKHCRMPGPGLVCLREGIPIAAGPHQAFAAGDSLPDGNIINDWLQQAGLLTAQPDASLEAPSAAPGMQDSDADDWQEPCAVCGRRYAHQHVPAVALRSGWSDDES